MKRIKRNQSDPAQQMFGLIFRPFNYPFKLRANDVIRMEGRLCRVVRVTDCAAVVVMNQPAREFKTIFDQPVRFRPKPKIVRICPNSEIEILNRKTK